jgi:hypothetical protein
MYFTMLACLLIRLRRHFIFHDTVFRLDLAETTEMSSFLLKKSIWRLYHFSSHVNKTLSIDVIASTTEASTM